MIGTIFNIAVKRLWNDKQELMLALVVPILFFSIFALIFSRGIGSGTPRVKLAVIDADGSDFSREVTRRLKKAATVEVDDDVFGAHPDLDMRTFAQRIIKQRNKQVVICLPPKMGANTLRGQGVTVQLLSEGSNPVGNQIVTALLGQVVSSATQPLQHRGFRPQLDRSTELQRLPGVTSTTALASHAEPFRTTSFGLLSIATENVIGQRTGDPKIAMYAAGIAVMFLLFSATGAGGSMLEDEEAGTLDRILCSRIGITQLLAGKWLYIVLLGCFQLTVMFAWAAIVFGVELLDHLRGFAVMTLFTAAATASFALCLAALSRSRAQLQGISIVVILTMSALGGSMIPRYIMSENLQRWGLWTFNAWALDGFKKVFWYEQPITALRTELIVLGAMTVGLGLVARVLADRWAAN